jgi:hypothetical protein
MIRVNLLPEEYRPTEGASWSVLLTAIVVIVVVAGTGIFFGYAKITASGLESDLQEATAEASRLKKFADEYEVLVRQIEEASVREKTIKEIAQSKINWGKKLDEFTDLILEDDMWIHELELIEGDKKLDVLTGETNWGSLRIKAYFCGISSGLANQFFRQVKNDRSFFSIFRDTSQPQTTREDINMVYHGTPFVEDDRLNLSSVIDLYLRGFEEAPQQASPTPGQ